MTMFWASVSAGFGGLFLSEMAGLLIILSMNEIVVLHKRTKKVILFVVAITARKKNKTFWAFCLVLLKS